MPVCVIPGGKSRRPVFCDRAHLFYSMSDQNFYLSDKDKDILSDMGVWEMTECLPIQKQRDRSSLK